MKPRIPVQTLILSLLFFSLPPGLAPANAESAGKNLQRAPDFTLRTLDGDLFTLSKNLGKGPVIIHFWATWCLPCLAEMKALKQIHETRKEDNLLILSLSVDDNKTSGKVKSHARTRKYPFTILMDGEKKVFDSFHASDMPHLFLLDKEGKITYSHQGFKNGDEKLLLAQLDALKP